jgi:hypothetical protein
MKSAPASLKEDNLVVFYYHGSYQVWLEKRGGLIRAKYSALDNRKKFSAMKIKMKC